jgi:hypothetical protein
MDFKALLENFPLHGTVLSVSKFGNGLINDSYRILTAEPDAPDYVLQRINHRVFTDVPLLQENIFKTIQHIRAKLFAADERDIDRKVLNMVVRSDGSSYYFDGANYWRVFILIRDSVSFEVLTGDSAYDVGKTFGDFEYLLADFPEELKEPIPNFHNIEFRVEQLRAAVAKDPFKYAATVRSIVDDLERRADEMCQVENWYRQGKIPKRICHCDTKINNMLFDPSGQVLCVFLDALEEPDLCPCPDEVVVFVLYLEVCASENVVGEEPYCLHVNHQPCPVGEVVDLELGEEPAC